MQVEAGQSRLLPVGVLASTGDGDDQDVRQFASRSNPARDLEPVHSGHAHIERHDREDTGRTGDAGRRIKTPRVPPDSLAVRVASAITMTHIR